MKLMRKQFKGKVSITRSSSCDKVTGERIDTIHVELIDEDSGCHVVTVDMHPATFGSAVTGLSYQDCSFTWFGAPLGSVREHKTVEVYVPAGDYKTDRDRAAEALRPYEVDGWVGRVSDACNSHNVISRKWAQDKRAEGAVYRVIFERFVPKEGPGEG